MGSCLSSESQTSIPGSTSASLVRRRKKSKKRGGTWSSSFVSRRFEVPGRLFANGATEFASLYTQQGKKGTNQDAMIVWENFGSRENTVFCGIFDGHGPYGHMVARRVRDQLPLKLSSHWEVALKSEEEAGPSIDVNETAKHPDVFQSLKESFLKAFNVTDCELRGNRSINCFCSGTTAVTLVKQGNNLFVGNVGDSRAVLATRDEDNSLLAVQLTVDLKPSLPAEAERIRRCRGRVFALQDEPDVVRVWLPDHDAPGLAMARAFGDFCLKDYGLISVPDVSHRLVTERDEFIVLATDGIWDVLTNEEVVDIVASAPNRDSAAKVLVESAAQAWRTKYPTSKADDCAVVCLFLDMDRTGVSWTTDQVEQKELLMGCSGTVTTVKDILPDTSDDDELSHQPHSGADWSALAGVTRVNTLLNLPRFVPGKSDKNSSVGRPSH